MAQNNEPMRFDTEKNASRPFYFQMRKKGKEKENVFLNDTFGFVCLVKLICSLFVADDSAFVCQFSRFFLLPVADWLVAAAAAFALP